jgi:hypothetical protein
VLRDGHWQLLETVPAWEGNPTHDGYVVAGWSVEDGAPLGWLVAVNVSDVQAQARVRLEHLLPEAEVLVLTDRMHPGTEYDGTSPTSPPTVCSWTWDRTATTSSRSADVAGVASEQRG